MTHKQWFKNVLHLHPVHGEGAGLWVRDESEHHKSQ